MFLFVSNNYDLHRFSEPLPFPTSPPYFIFYIYYRNLLFSSLDYKFYARIYSISEICDIDYTFVGDVFVRIDPLSHDPGYDGYFFVFTYPRKIDSMRLRSSRFCLQAAMTEGMEGKVFLVGLLPMEISTNP